MIKLTQAVIVEGKYDKAKLSSVVDAVIVTTDGFDVFRSRDKLNFIRSLAEKRGIIILTDSDAAGFRIRSYLSGAIPSGRITHVYIPDLFGKERRKPVPSAEGKLGVEGVPVRLLLEAFARAGITPFADEAGRASPTPDTGGVKHMDGANDAENPRETDPVSAVVGGSPESPPIDKADLVEWGISGGEDSAERRRKLLRSLGMPARMNSNALIKVLNSLYTREEIIRSIGKL